MQLTGHRSRAIFDRYNIVREEELHEAGAQLHAYLVATVDGLPAAVLNRAPDHPDDPTPRARDAGGSRSGVPADCTPDPRDGADR